MRLKILCVCLVIFALQLSAAETRHYVVAMSDFENWRQVAKNQDCPDFLPAISAVGMKMTLEEAAALTKDPKVRYVAQDVERHIYAANSFPAGQFWYGQMNPWGIVAVRALEAQKIAKGKGVGVVVLDTGVDCTNEDLAGHCVSGYDFVNSTSIVKDDNGHGTHLAGTIAASDNSIGVIGMAPDANVIAVKVLGADGKGNGTDILNGMQWILDHQVQYNIWVVNMSFGDRAPYQPEKDMINRLEDAGIVVVAASGNDGLGTPSYPGAYATLNVGAVDEFLKVANFSNWLPDIVAPGVYIPSTAPFHSGPWAWIEMANGDLIQADSLVYSPTGSATANLRNCGLGNTGDFTVASAQGNDYIALVQRGGGLTFAQKTIASITAQAKAEIIFNNAPGMFQGTLGNASSGWTIVTLSVSDTDGAKLLTAKGQTVSANSSVGDYQHMSGTSMATPHVAGAVALLFSAFPDTGLSEIKNALLSSATHIGTSVPDPQSGYGILNVWYALQYMQNVRNGFPRRRAANH